MLQGGVGNVQSVESVDITKMALLRYLKVTDDPNGFFILRITKGNDKVRKAINSGMQAKIGKYASHHDVTAALHFVYKIIYMIASNKIIPYHNLL